MFNASSPEMIWFLVGLVFLFSELVIPTFVLMFFGVGSWVAAAFVFFGLAPFFGVQVSIFTIASLLSLWLFRTKGKELSRGGITQGVELDSVVGCFGVVIEELDPQKHSGKIELHGTNWQATSDELIVKGTTVEVLSRTNLTLKVKPINK